MSFFRVFDRRRTVRGLLILPFLLSGGFAWAAQLEAASSSGPADVGWSRHGLTAHEERFSPLAQVRDSNVHELGLAWSYETGSHRGQEATPIVVDGVLYATSTWSVVFALDARTGRELWRFDPGVPKSKGRDACCDVVNRGVAVHDGRVFVGTLDGRLIALDAKSGAKRWEVQTTDPAQPYTITGAPRIAKGLVVIGNGGAEFGVRGYVSAYRPEDGERVWRFYTVPASSEGPFEHPELARAAKTWSKDSLWESGLGGTVWDSIAFDPELDLLYVGVGNSSVYDRTKRSPGGGDNLFLASILALRPDTGRLVWHYQTVPGENWDYTATQHMILADLELVAPGGERSLRKVLMQAPKNGFFYVLDRATGELLSADAYTELNWASHVDLASGRPVETGAAEWANGEAMVLPGVTGAHSWHPMAFSPQTRLVYIPAVRFTYPFHADPDFEFLPGSRVMNTGESFPALARAVDGYERALRFCKQVELVAWDPVARRRVWERDFDTAVNGGVLTTAGNLVFHGTGTGRFVAYRASSGEELWSSDTGVGIIAPPITYRLDGEQYVAVLAGAGGSLGMSFERQIRGSNRGRLVAYKLGASKPMPPVPPRDRPAPASRAQLEKLASSDASEIERGLEAYNTFCFRCHGIGTKSTGLLPDLRRASPAVHEQWSGIVLGGLRASRGMPSFADAFGVDDARAIQAYVVAQALREPSLAESAADWATRRMCIPAHWLAD